MGDGSAIEWTDATWNPIRGCSRVSEGCRNCYAERTAIRQVGGAYAGLVKQTPGGPRWTGEVRFVEEALNLPLSWKRPRRIFVNSMSDLFHEKVDTLTIGRILNVIGLARQHTFQVLSKRPERMRVVVNAYWKTVVGGIYPNVELGVSVEDQATADARIPLLLQTPAARRFVSYEPALGPIFLTKFVSEKFISVGGRQYIGAGGIHWLIVGGESGPGARSCDLAWIRSAVAQCKAAGVAVFVKQLGARPCNCAGSHSPSTEAPWERLYFNDPKGGDPDEWPADLRMREFPR